jgi:hypothetical protein
MSTACFLALNLQFEYVLLRVAASAAPRLPSRNSGVSRSISCRTEAIRTFVTYATQGIELEWEGSGTDEGALCRKTGKTPVDASKTAKKPGWVPRTGLGAIIEEWSVEHRAKAVPLLLQALAPVRRAIAHAARSDIAPPTLKYAAL